MHFFADKICGNIITLSAEDSLHAAKSLRLSKGAEITVCGKNGYDYYCRVEDVGRIVSLSILYEKISVSEPDISLKLYQSLPKSDKMDYIIQKSVELGASEIIPVITSRSISRPNNEKMLNKISRYKKIAHSAAMQSQRGIIPAVGDIINFDEAINRMSDDDTKIIFYEGGGTHISKILDENAKSISVFIGCEGGFSEDEVDKARSCGISVAGLGNRILRCETAPLTVISIIMFLTGNI